MDKFVEEACRAWYDAAAGPGQWDKLVELDDAQLTGWRIRMRAALDAVGFFHLVDHHLQHHQGSGSDDPPAILDSWPPRDELGRTL